MRKFKKNDEVVVISGAHKGSVGKIVKIDWKNERVVVDKVNIVKKHNKPSQTNPDGGIEEFEAPIHISKIALKSGKDGFAKVGFKVIDNKKIRINKKTGKAI